MDVSYELFGELALVYGLLIKVVKNIEYFVVRSVC